MLTRKVDKLLVYGTLKQGYYNHRVIEGARFLGEQMVGPYTMHHLGAFPACTIEPRSLIHAELYAITDAILDKCDILEGYPSFYYRHVVQYGPKEEDAAWMYFINTGRLPSLSPVIETGEWK